MGVYSGGIGEEVEEKAREEEAENDGNKMEQLKKSPLRLQPFGGIEIQTNHIIQQNGRKCNENL